MLEVCALVTFYNPLSFIDFLQDGAIRFVSISSNDPMPQVTFKVFLLRFATLINQASRKTKSPLFAQPFTWSAYRRFAQVQLTVVKRAPHSPLSVILIRRSRLRRSFDLRLPTWCARTWVPAVPLWREVVRIHP